MLARVERYTDGLTVIVSIPKHDVALNGPNQQKFVRQSLKPKEIPFLLRESKNL